MLNKISHHDIYKCMQRNIENVGKDAYTKYMFKKDAYMKDAYMKNPYT